MDNKEVKTEIPESVKRIVICYAVLLILNDLSKTGKFHEAHIYKVYDKNTQGIWAHSTIDDRINYLLFICRDDEYLEKVSN